MKRIIVTIVVVVVVALGTNGLQYYLQKKEKAKITEEFQQQINVLQDTIASYGENIPYYEVAENVFPGEEVTDTMLEAKTIPEAFATEGMIHDANEIIGKYAKVGLNPGTPITADLLMEEVIDDTTRDVDIVVCHYPVGLRVGDYVDIRLSMPFGQDYIVLSHCRIQELNSITIKLYLTEAQQLRYKSSCVDYYLSSEHGSDLYMTKYLEPGLQQSAVEMYAVSDFVRQCMTTDSNIVDKAQAKIASKLRATIQEQVGNEKFDLWDPTTEEGAEHNAQIYEQLQQGWDDYKQSVASDSISSYEATQEEEEQEKLAAESEEEYVDLNPDEPVDVTETPEEGSGDVSETPEDVSEEESVEEDVAE